MVVLLLLNAIGKRKHKRKFEYATLLFLIISLNEQKKKKEEGIHTKHTSKRMAKGNSIAHIFYKYSCHMHFIIIAIVPTSVGRLHHIQRSLEVFTK